MRPLRTPVAVLIATAALAPPPASATFVDVATGAVADSGRAWGTVFADFDGDGRPDIYFQNTAIAPSKLLINGGGGVFTEARPLPTQYALAPAAGDADGDGDLDLYVTSAGLANRLLRNEGSGDFIDVTLSPVDDAAQGRSASWADADGDGDLDLYHAVHSQGPNRLFRNEGGAVFVDATAPPLDDTLFGEGTAWGDYDGDGDADLYLQNGLGNVNKLFRNDGALGFADVTSPPLDGGTSSGRGAAWGDYDNDGDLDLFLANEYTDACKLLRNDGASGFADVTTPDLAMASQAFGCGWADYDNDGWLDLYVATFGSDASTGAPNRLHRNQGDGTFASALLGAATDTSRSLAAAWADYDADGDLDLYCAEYEAPNRLLRNDAANGNHWLHVDLVGTVSNSLGVGARIVLTAGGLQQLREVGGDMGYMSQGSFTAEFGLGAATGVDQLTVHWPSGTVQPVAVVGVDQRITVVEAAPVASPETVAGAGEGLRLLGGAPSPFRGSTTIRYALPAAASVRLTVHDVRGRRVAVLVEENRPGGDQAVIWSGTTTEGRSVPAGVYFLRLDAGGEVTTKRVVKLR